MENRRENELGVFLSWSGERSKAAAQAFRDWLPGALQSVRPFYNWDDTSKGSRWGNGIQGELENSDFGIIFLTPENLTSHWILFEAGALSKLEKSKVVPFLLGVEPTDVSGPLMQFQATKPNHEDCFKLFKSLNQSSGESGIDPSLLEDVFSKWWPSLDEKLQQAISMKPVAHNSVRRSERDLIEETLERIRRIERESSADNEHDIVVYETAQTMWMSIESVLERIVMDLQHSDDKCSASCLALVREIESAALNFKSRPYRMRGG